MRYALLLLLLVVACDRMPTAPKLDCKPVAADSVTHTVTFTSRPKLSSTVCGVR